MLTLGIGGSKAAPQLKCGAGCASVHHPVSTAGTCFPLPDSGKGAWPLLQMRQLCLIAEAPAASENTSSDEHTSWEVLSPVQLS